MRDQLVEQQQEEDEGFKEDYKELRERKTRNLRLDDEYFYTEEDIREDQHFLRNSSQPICVLIGRDVFANEDILPEVELAICFNY